MPVLHALLFPLSCNVLFSRTVWAFEGWPSIHISVAITLCYYLSRTSVEMIKFLFMSLCKWSHFMPTFLWLFKQNKISAFRSTRSPLHIPVEFGFQPVNLSEVNNVLNLAPNPAAFHQRSRNMSWVIFRHQKQKHLVFAFTLCLLDALMQHLHYLHPRSHINDEQYSLQASCF